MLRAAGGTTGFRGNPAGREGLPAAPAAPPPPLPGGSRLSSLLLRASSFADHPAAPRSAGEWIRKGLYSSGR